MNLGAGQSGCFVLSRLAYTHCSESMSAIKFGTDGWRGIIAEDFTFENARIVAHAIARYVVRSEDARKGVIVGYDNRYLRRTQLAETGGGSDFFDRNAGVARRQALPDACNFVVRAATNAAGGVMVTASHNPYQWNGIKYKASYGSSALPSIVAQIETRAGGR